MISEEHIKKSIFEFQSCLINQESNFIVRKKIIFGGCAVISDDQYLKLREDTASSFNIHPNEVLVVGSAKLGFSIAPHKRYKPFGDNSDIDLVIVNSKLFDEIWYLLFEYWKSKAFWDKHNEFKNYLFQGWIRPDYFPYSNSVTRCNEWRELFRELTSSRNYGPYKISGALYKSWNFIEQYQIKAIESCKENLGELSENKRDQS